LKKGQLIETLKLAPQKECHGHLFFIEIMHRKFHWVGLKTVEEVEDTSFLYMVM